MTGGKKLPGINENDNRKTEYIEPEVMLEELSPEDQELAAKIAERKRLNRIRVERSKRRRVVLMVLAFAMLLTMCSREIVRLQTENRELRRQHAQLEQERDRLTKELSNVNDKEYIKDQARKQLRLLDPGEVMFVFEDDSQQQEETVEEETPEEGASGEEDEGSEE